jgi:hypothetical protein
MIPRLVAALPMLSLWLLFFLWGNGNNGATTIPKTMVEAFSTPPIATGGGASTTWATRRQRITTQQQQQQQQQHTGSFSSLTAWRSSCPKVGKDGLYHITTEEEFRYVQQQQQL